MTVEQAAATNNAAIVNAEGEELALTRHVEYNITFKLPKGTKKNENGEPVDELGNPVIKRAPFKLQVPVPTLEGLRLALKDEKQREFILDLIAAEVYRAARIQTDDDEKPVVSTEGLDISKLTLHFLANQPAAERRGGGISKELWEEWSKDYISIMPTVTGKEVSAVQNAALIFLKRCQTVKTNKPVLKFLQEQLALWATSTEKLDDFADIFEFLDNKIKTFLQADDASLLANLM